jgi:DeoR C terminal sensor domain
MASIVRSGQLLLIDAGSTNLAAARSLPEGIEATVATQDPTIASVLAGGTDLTLITIGGKVNPLIGAAVDGQALRVILGYAPRIYGPRELRSRRLRSFRRGILRQYTPHSKSRGSLKTAHGSN